MTYLSAYRMLASLFDQSKDKIIVPGHNVEIINCRFHSKASNVLPGAKDYFCHEHNLRFAEPYTPPEPNDPLYHELLNVPDCEIQSNTDYSYSIFKPKGTDRSHSVIFLYHGLNEKRWNKYLPWALHLVETTGKAVVLVPIAFHMNRTPSEWSDMHAMVRVSELRQQSFPAIAHSSFANAAISARLQESPQRFFWSGLQSYLDTVQLAREIKKNLHSHIAPDARIDFFAYSIGSFLSELILMIDPDQLFSNSKLFIFCGGPTMDRMYPGSKYIMDSEAVIALHAFLIEHLDNEFKRHPWLAHHFQAHHGVWNYFRAMLSNPKHKALRENRFRALSDRIQALALRQDEVIPPVEVLNTLQGDFRDIPIKVQVLDFPYSYSHINPFPNRESIEQEVNESFHTVFQSITAHLR